ncbi:hypothetical protein RHECNPAF_1260016 [Rhizobium etli CNPAF512]|nr:hypothetical protein RHECNPAF_1260016 [Rhizobium etli CNPAF512]
MQIPRHQGAEIGGGAPQEEGGAVEEKAADDERRLGTDHGVTVKL